MTFEGHRLDLQTRQLFRGADEVPLSPKAFDLLQALVENRARALSKAELHERLWPDTFVTDGNLASLVAELRRALGDRSETPRFIRTVHRFGYAFCARVHGAAEAPIGGRRCWVVWQGRETSMQAGDNVIGRDATAALRLDFPSVSRRHARIVVTPDGATIEDLGSKNGTLLQNARVTGVAALADFDEIQIGSVKMTVRLMHGAAPTQTIAG